MCLAVYVALREQLYVNYYGVLLLFVYLQLILCMEFDFCCVCVQLISFHNTIATIIHVPININIFIIIWIEWSHHQ